MPARLAQLVSDIVGSGRPLSAPSVRAAGLVRRALIHGGDPVITYNHGGTPLRIPLSHPLPGLRARFPRYDLPIREIVRRLEPTTGDVVVDVGANVGDTAAMVRAESPVPLIAVEGVQEFLDFLADNTSSMTDVEIVPVFAGSSSTGMVSTSVARGTAHVVGPSQERPTVATKTLDSILRDSQLASGRRVRLIKIDTDGFELEVLRGATKSLDKHHPIVFLEYDPALLARQGGTGREIRDLLQDLGYRSLWIYDNYGEPMWRASLHDLGLLDQLDRYLTRRHPDYYCDILFEPPGEDELARQLAVDFGS